VAARPEPPAGCGERRRERRRDDAAQVTYDAPTREWSTPDGCWDLVVLKRAGQTTVLHTGLISRPVLLENGPGDSYLAISFKPGVFATRALVSKWWIVEVVRPLAPTPNGPGRHT
jgi:hypothetical protein